MGGFMSWLERGGSERALRNLPTDNAADAQQQLSHRDKNRNKNMERVSIFVFQISYHENRAILISFCSNAFLTFIPVWKYVSTFGV